MMIAFLIFLLGIVLRFLYFPDNIYFGYDQARDFYSALSVLGGDLKVVGPPSSFDGNIFHGPLIYYFYAPFVWLSSGSLELVALFLRLYNSIGVFLVFVSGSIVFNRRVGLIAALLFAISFEQSQYALFLGHPVLAVIPVLSFYLGIALLVFKKEWKGLLLSAVSLGLAIQFHYVHMLLVFGLIILLGIFRHELWSSLKWKHLVISLVGFLIVVSSFLISEMKYGFRLSRAAWGLLITIVDRGSQRGVGDLDGLGYGGQMLQRLIRHNFADNGEISLAIIAILTIFIIWLFRNAKYRKRGLFLTIWVLAGILPYVLTKSPSYYYGAGSSAGLLVLAAFLIDRVWTKSPIVAILLLAAITLGNLSMIINSNKAGPNLDIVIQPQMLFADEKKVLDYIYQQSSGQPIVVKGLTVPFLVNTTWSYLFEGYGKNKYGYLPTWMGPVADGYAGNLSVINSRSDLPPTQFLIIEPTIGIREGTKQQFFEEEGYFTKMIEEKQFGQFKVQKRLRY